MLKDLASRIREYRKEAILTPLLMVGEVFMEVLIPALMAQIIDIGVSQGNISYTVKMSILLVLCAFASMFFGVMGAKTASIASSGFARNLRHDLYYKIEDFSFSNIDSFSTSSLITRLTTDVQNVQMAFQMVIRMFVRSPIMFLFAIIMVAKNGGSVMFIYIVAVPILAAGIFFMMSKAHPKFEKAFKSYDGLNRVVGENLNGIRTVKAYVREEEETGKFDESAGEIYNNFVSAQKIMAFSQPMMSSVMYLCIVAVCYVGARLINIGHMTTGQLMSIFTYNAQILMSLIMVGMFMVMVMMVLVLVFVLMVMVVLTVAAIACYAMTLGPVTWVLLSEIFPGRVRGTAMAVCTFALWVGSCTLTFAFPSMNAGLGCSGSFWIYAGICLLGFLYFLRSCPETRGKTLEQLENELTR